MIWKARLDVDTLCHFHVNSTSDGVYMTVTSIGLYTVHISHIVDEDLYTVGTPYHGVLGAMEAMISAEHLQIRLQVSLQWSPTSHTDVRALLYKCVMKYYGLSPLCPLK